MPKKVFSIEFDGVMANSDVWINGKHLGKRPYGYVSFAYDLTPYLHFDKPNVIAVELIIRFSLLLVIILVREFIATFVWFR